MSKGFLDMDIDELRADCLELERINAALLAACKDLADRCDRARELLKHGQGGHWGMLDTASTREVIAAAETSNPKGER